MGSSALVISHFNLHLTTALDEADPLGSTGANCRIIAPQMTDKKPSTVPGYFYFFRPSAVPRGQKNDEGKQKMQDRQEFGTLCSSRFLYANMGGR